MLAVLNNIEAEAVRVENLSKQGKPKMIWGKFNLNYNINKIYLWNNISWKYACDLIKVQYL